jgi:secondary thiamine-phosphate synthase enzyme
MPPLRELSLRSERKTQLIDITARVREAIEGESGSAVLVYVPHTTAAVTINEKIDPALVADLERAFENVVRDEWGWVHDDADGPNGPSHGRASVAGAEVLIPLRDGAPALGRYQAVFLCEFDGPKERSVYVTVLQ